MRQSYQEGDVFEIPLGENRVHGVIARGSGDAKVILAYIFQSGDKKNLDQLTPNSDRLLLTGRVGDLHIIDGKWKVIGRIPSWGRSDWPNTYLVRQSPGIKPILVRYSDDNPLIEIDRRPATAEEVEEYPDDGVMGAGYVEKVLLSLLQNL